MRCGLVGARCSFPQSKGQGDEDWRCGTDPFLLSRSSGRAGPARPCCWRGSQHLDAERVLDHRPGRHHHQISHRRLRRFDLFRLQRLRDQRGQVRGAHGGRGIPFLALECRHRERAPREVGGRRLRHLQQQDRGREVVHAGQLDTRRHLRDVWQRWAAGALGLQEPDGHLQLFRGRRRPSTAARPTWQRAWTSSTPTPIRAHS